MPNKNQQSPTPVIPQQMDLPPLPPDFVTQGTPSHTAQNSTPTTASPSSFPPATPTKQKNKFGGRRVIATILGIFLLVGAVSAGVILTGQRQLLQQNAQAPAPATVKFTKAGKVRIYYFDYLKASPGESFGKFTFKFNTSSGAKTSTLKGGVLPSGQKMEYIDTGISVKAGDTFTAVKSFYNGSSKANVGWIAPVSKKCGPSKTDASSQINYAAGIGQPLVSQQCWGDPAVSGGSNADYNDFFVIFSYTPPGATPKPTSKPTPTPKPGTTPTPTPASSPIPRACTPITIYSSTWDPVNRGRFSILKDGTSVYFCVPNFLNNSNYQVVFTINGVVQSTAQVTRPGSQDACIPYEIPPDTTDFKVEGTVLSKTTN